MGDVLTGLCTVNGGRGPIYWWPLVCEVLYTHGFTFASSDLPTGKSIYSYYHYLFPYAEETEEIKTVTGSFREFWDEVYAGGGSVTGTFSLHEEEGEGLSLEVSVTSNQEKSSVTINFHIPGGIFRDTSREIAHKSLKLIFACIWKFYEVCEPTYGEIFWENSSYRFAPWAMIGECDAFSDERRPKIQQEGQTLEHLVLQNGQNLSFFNPVPVMRRGEKGKYWEFLTII